MNENINIILQRIVERKAKEFFLEKEKQCHIGSVVSNFTEEWHFLRAVWFLHSTLITTENKIEFILFANETNLVLHSGGRFWCNENMDFAYEIVLTEEIIEKCEEEATSLLFDVVLSSYHDFQIPLIMLKSGIWRADTAIQYIKELRIKGVVDHSEYLWKWSIKL